MRIFDATALNRIANLPKVRPLLGGDPDKAIDLTEQAADIERHYLFYRDMVGGFYVHQLHADGNDVAYECHTMAIPGCSARALARFAKDCIEYMFLRTDCSLIRTKVAEDNGGAAWLAKQVNFKPRFFRKDAHAPGVGYDYLDITLDAWVAACSTLQGKGQQFHHMLEAAKSRIGSELESHPEDFAHDTVVGAALAMCEHGNFFKGLNLYNKWAIFAGYAQAHMVSALPPVVDIEDALIGIDQGKMEVLLCR